MRIAALAAVLLGLTACAADGVSQARLMTDLKVLAADDMEGRLVGTPGSQKARDYIVGRFEQEGLKPAGTDGWFHRFTIQMDGKPVEATNIVGVRRGSRWPDRYIVVTAHYDHEGIKNGQIYNGADDNASGVSALFEIARALRGRAPRHSILFVALDAEEEGLLGAEAFVRTPPVPREAMQLNINLDMISRSDKDELWAVGTTQYPALRPVLLGLKRDPRLTLHLGRDGPNDKGRMNWVNLSDQAAFHAAGIPFIYFSVDDHADYHQPTDDPERIDPEFYTGVVATVLEALKAFDRMDLSGLKSR